MTIGQDIDAMLAKLKTQRDELKLQAHLFKAEAREEWEKAEARLQHIQQQAKRAGDASGEVGEDILEATKNVGRQIQDGYKKIRNSL